MKGLFLRVVYAAIARVFGRKGDWMDAEKSGNKSGGKGAKSAAAAAFRDTVQYDPWEETRALMEPVKSPVLSLIKSVRAGTATIVEASLVYGRYNEDGRMLPERLREADRPHFRVKRVRGTEAFLAALTEAETAYRDLPARAALAKNRKKEALRALNETKLREDFYDRNSILDGVTTRSDRAQFTEYTPIMGGPFHKQLYMFDALRSLALAFEAKNHNPIAKRVIDIRTEYTVGRGFKISSKDQGYLAQVDGVVMDIKLRDKAPVWSDEFDTYGELFIDNIKWQSIDPSTIWQVVHEPDDVNKEVYLFQSYPTDYQMFTGYKVPGAPGSEKVESSKYIVRQVPASQYIHIKQNCVSNEVRGRSILFPIHGWLKMAKDLLEAETIRAKLQACQVFDVTITGDDQDVQNVAREYSGMPVPGSLRAHNDQVKFENVAVMPQSSTGASSGIFEAVMSVIATNTGIPKEHLNVNSRAGSRATALVSSEPFAKVIEKRQIIFEDLIHRILAIELPRRGIPYQRELIEIVFPNVSKDATSETITNIQTAEEMGYISKRTAGNMVAAELGITTYDYDAEQQQMAKDRAAGLDQLGDPPPPQSRTGGAPGGAPGAAAPGEEDGAGIHGQDRLDAMSAASAI
jgi:hypothetical protein